MITAMSKSYSNKPLVILKTAFIVSFLFAVGLGIIFTVYKGHTLNQFFYLTYLFFVNNLLMPISVAAIVCYYISREQNNIPGIIGRLKIIAILSLVSFVLLFIWNSVDFLFHYHLNQPLTLDTLILDLQQEFILGAILALPISVVIFLTYSFIDSIES
jgi:hypothetical protein